jgi:hypothetical protein
MQESALWQPIEGLPSGHDAEHEPVAMQQVMPEGQPLMTQAGSIGPPSPMFVDPLLLLLPVPPLLLLLLPLPLLLLLLPASFPEFELVDPPQATATITAPPNHTLTKRLTFFIEEPLSEKRWWPDPTVRARPCRVSPPSPAPIAFFRRRSCGCARVNPSARGPAAKSSACASDLPTLA